MTFEQKGKRVFLILMYLLVSVLHGKAQTNMVFYPIENQFNSSNLNPAYIASQRQFTFSIFPMAGINVGYNNQRVLKDMLTKVLQGDQTNSDFREVFSSMMKLDLFYQKMETSLLYLGYNSDFGSFNFRVQENIQMMMGLKGEFSEFLTNSSSQSILVNNPQMFPAQALHYREYGLGYAREIMKGRLSVGVRAKLYFGKFSVSSDVQGEVAKRDDNFYLQIRDQVKFSFPMNVIQDSFGYLSSVEPTDDFSVGNYLTNSKNIGTGFDIGLTYKITPDLTFSASVLDLGKINWKNNLNRMTFDGEYPFPQSFIVSSGDNILTKNEGFSNETTDFSQLYKIEIDKNSSFSTRLPTTIFSGLKYKLNPKVNISVVNRYIKVKDMNFNSLSATGVFDVKKDLTVSAGYAIVGDSYTNMPFAVLYNWHAGQSYIGTDNLLSFIVPSGSEFSGITIGTCFFLFRDKTKYKEQLEYLPFYKEKKIRPGTTK